MIGYSDYRYELGVKAQGHTSRLVARAFGPAGYLRMLSVAFDRQVATFKTPHTSSSVAMSWMGRFRDY